MGRKSHRALSSKLVGLASHPTHSPQRCEITDAPGTFSGQIRTVVSKLPEIRAPAEASQARVLTEPVCPSRRANSLPAAMSQTRTRLSLAPAATRFGPQYTKLRILPGRCASAVTAA